MYLVYVIFLLLSAVPPVTQDLFLADQDVVITVVQTNVGLEVSAGNMEYYFSSETGDVRMNINGKEVFSELRPVLGRDMSGIELEDCGDLNLDSMFSIDLDSCKRELKFWNIYGPNKLPTVKSKVLYTVDDGRTISAEYDYKFHRNGSVRLVYRLQADFPVSWLPEAGMEARMRNVTAIEWDEVVGRDSLMKADSLESLQSFSANRKSENLGGVKSGVKKMVLKDDDTSLMICEESSFFRWDARRNRLRFLAAAQTCFTNTNKNGTTEREELLGDNDTYDLKGALLIKHVH